MRERQTRSRCTGFCSVNRVLGRIDSVGLAQAADPIARLAARNGEREYHQS